MPRYVIEDLTEVKRWYDEGVTYREMVRRYRERGINTRESTFSERAKREGWEPRGQRYRDRLPWRIDPKHRNKRPRVVLRTLARAEDGEGVPHDEVWRTTQLFKDALDAEDLVVRYEPDTEQGFFVVPRRQGVDTWYVHEPTPEPHNLDQK